MRLSHSSSCSNDHRRPVHRGRLLVGHALDPRRDADPVSERRKIDAGHDRAPDSRRHTDPDACGRAYRQPDEVRRRHAARGRTDCDLAVAQADRFETFGDMSIRLEQVWSPNDIGLGGTCGATNVPWLECGDSPTGLIQTFEDGADCPFTSTTFCYDGPRLDILYEPGMGERLGLGDGPVDLIGHFGDPASESCRPENRDACRDRFVVTAIEQAGR